MEWTMLTRSGELFTHGEKDIDSVVCAYYDEVGFSKMAIQNISSYKLDKEGKPIRDCS